jgi:peptidoglycan/LPS O-acetylase OafA/YrhL
MHLTIEANEWPFLMAVIAALVGMGFQLAFVFSRQRRKAKKPVKAAAAFALAYVVIVYLAAIANVATPLMGKGVLSSIGFVVLVILLITDTIADWKGP